MDNNSHPLPHRTMQHRRGELTAGDLRLAQLAFERGAADEEFVHFGDDAFLFGEGWEGNDRLLHFTYVQVWLSTTLGETT